MDTGRSSTAAQPTPKLRLRSTPPILLATSGVLLAFHLYMSRHMQVPVLFSDTFGYLANAKYLAGVGAVPLIPTPFCHFGYSLLLVPGYWWSSEPAEVFRFALLVNAILASVHFLVLYAVGISLFSLRKRDAYLAALAASLYPAYLLVSNLGWTESLAPLVFTGWVAMASVLVRSGQMATVLGFVGVSIFAYAVHPRFLPLLPLVAGVMAWLRYKVRINTLAFLAGATALVFGYAATELVNDRLHNAMWAWQEAAATSESARETGTAATAPSSSIKPAPAEPTMPAALNISAESSGAAQGMRVLAKVSTLAQLDDLAITLTGQVWYLLCASLGLVAPGLMTLFSLVRRHGPNPGNDPNWNRGVTAAVALMGTAGVLLASVLQTTSVRRLDGLIYGRYNETFLAIFLLAGVAAMLRPQRGRRDWIALAVGVLGIPVLAAVLLWARGDRLDDTLIMPLTVLGLLVFEPTFDWQGSAEKARCIFRAEVVSTIALGASAGFMLLATRWRRSAVVLLCMFFVYAAIDVEPRTIRPIHNWARGLVWLHSAIPDEHRGDIGYDLRGVNWYGMNGYQFHLPNRQFKIFDGRNEEAPVGLVIAKKSWKPIGSRRAMALAYEPVINQALWSVEDTAQQPAQ